MKNLMENPKPFDLAQGRPTPSKTPKTEKLPYEPPQATFIPLKLEERLLACDKAAPACVGLWFS